MEIVYVCVHVYVCICVCHLLVSYLFLTAVTPYLTNYVKSLSSGNNDCLSGPTPCDSL